MLILGINSAYHETAAALLDDGRLIAFVEEERINRRKHGKPSAVDNPDELPLGAIRECLSMAGATFDDVDLIGYSFDQKGRKANIGVDTFATSGSWGTQEGEERFHAALMRVPDNLQKLGTKPLAPRFRWIPHHLAHAGSAFLASPFERAVVMTIDGIGEFDSLCVWSGEGTQLKPLFVLPYPHSLGFLWEKVCQFLGFSEYDACKVMGLSSYGNRNRLAAELAQIAQLHEDGTFRLSLEHLHFRAATFDGLSEIFGPPRLPGEPILERHQDLAAAVQAFTEEALMAMATRARRDTRAPHLTLSGGVALNCVANSRLEREAGYERLFVQPAANDAGTALGAALVLWTQECGKERVFVQDHPYYGPSYTVADCERAISERGLTADRPTRPEEAVASLVADGRVVGWFQGRMEMGPRALGNRTLLADPRRHDMRDLLNRKVKHREPFRPFAPSVLAEKATDWFDMPGRTDSTDFMLFAYPARPDKRERIPAVVHVDGTSRIQTVRASSAPRYHSLISAFERRTGVPMVLNTSFNDSEPIVMSPTHAINTFLKTGIDAVMLEGLLVRKPGVEPPVTEP
ncbi:MAG TPA: carbamoyltransferase C-terminal domain-containing protein [Candidatus Ozemobacteraceae bacterium]|nr:carbamoyltransferase C-terminal domain-containing protein [Candidatus Ozemobacteraceae bacterium]